MRRSSLVIPHQAPSVRRTSISSIKPNPVSSTSAVLAVSSVVSNSLPLLETANHVDLDSLRLLSELQEILTLVQNYTVTQGSADGEGNQFLLEEGEGLINDVARISQKVASDMKKSPLRRALKSTVNPHHRSDQIAELRQRIELFQNKLQLILLSQAESLQETSDFFTGLNDIYTVGLHAAVENGKRDLVIRLLGRGAKVSTTDAEGRTSVHLAARNGRRDLLEELLKHDKEAVDTQDIDGRTPLYYAVAGDYLDVASLLLAKGADANTIDRLGQTILSLTFGDEGRQELADELVKHGASPVIGVDGRVLKFISAAGLGNDKVILKLLEEGVDVNSKDGFGYNALYEAARFGRCEIVKLLIAAGAKLNAKIGLGGDTALHGIVDKGWRWEQLMQSFEGILPERVATPLLSYHHLEVVQTLLQYGALSDIKRWDTLTVHSLASKVLAGETIGDDRRIVLNPKERHVVMDLQEMLENPPPVKRKARPENWSPLPQKLSKEREEVCKYFKVRVQYHKKEIFKHRVSTLERLIYDSEKAKKCFAELEKWASTKQNEMLDLHNEGHGNQNETDGNQDETHDQQDETPDQYWRWIHLPANNKRWVKDLIRVLPTSLRTWTLETFIDDSYQEFRGSAPYARYRKPSFTKLDGDDGVFSLVIPYFDMETESFLNRRQERENKHFLMKQQLEDAYRHGGAAPEDLHLACTLDQSYYMSLPDTSDRDRDQVVCRFYSEIGECAEGVIDALARRDTKKESHPLQDGKQPGAKKDEITKQQLLQLSMKEEPSRIVMVNQLWLWKIDKNTIITAFPERWHEGQEDDILSHIFGPIWDTPPSSLDQMISNILQQCIGFVDAPSNAGLDENLFDIFEQSIAKVSNNETMRYETFCKQQRKCTELNMRIRNKKTITKAEKESFKEAEDEICDISHEIKHLEEIKDIRDELRMIQRVLEDQQVVLEKYYRNNSKGEFDFEELSSLYFRCAKAKRLYREAKSVEASLKNLLDLKQKQGNLNEARDMRKLADEAENRALAGETQSQLLFIFTVVTVIYTPIAFTSGFFAIPSSDFPQVDGGSGTSWRWWQIFLGSLVAEAATLLVAFLYWFSQSPKRVEKTPKPPGVQPSKPTGLQQASQTPKNPEVKHNEVSNGAPKSDEKRGRVTTAEQLV